MGMFRIGEFSRIARVTIDTLRHYDALGLLKPAAVDPSTGYRYYAARQLEPLNRILALKESGLSLEEIARILQNRLDNEGLRGVLRVQLALAETEMQAAQTRRERIVARLNYLELEDKMPPYEVALKSVEALTVAAIRQTVPTIDEMPQRCGAMLDSIAQWMVSNGLPFGPALTTYYSESFTRENVDTECAFVIPDAAAAKAAPPAAPIEVRQMAGAPLVAYTVVAGDFYRQVDGLTPAYHAIARWIEENGYQISGPARELFYGSPAGGDLTAEIQFPVENTRKK